MKTTHTIALAAAALLTGCSATGTGFKGGTERHGKVTFSDGKEQVAGDIAIHHDASNFHATITKSGGAPLLTLNAKFGTPNGAKDAKFMQMTVVHASGPLAHGGWSWRPADSLKKTDDSSLKDPSRAWAALPEVFMWGEAKATGGEESHVTLDNVAMHSRAADGHVKWFDYSRYNKTAEGPLDLKELRKYKKLETVTVHLD